MNMMYKITNTRIASLVLVQVCGMVAKTESHGLGTLMLHAEKRGIATTMFGWGMRTC